MCHRRTHFFPSFPRHPLLCVFVSLCAWNALARALGDESAHRERVNKIREREKSGTQARLKRTLQRIQKPELCSYFGVCFNRKIVRSLDGSLLYFFFFAPFFSRHSPLCVLFLCSFIARSFALSLSATPRALFFPLSSVSIRIARRYGMERNTHFFFCVIPSTVFHERNTFALSLSAVYVISELAAVRSARAHTFFLFSIFFPFSLVTLVICREKVGRLSPDPRVLNRKIGKTFRCDVFRNGHRLRSGSQDTLCIRADQ